MNWRLGIAIVALLLGSALAVWLVLPADTARLPAVSMEESAVPANQPVAPLESEPEPEPEADAPRDRTLAGLEQPSRGLADLARDMTKRSTALDEPADKAHEDRTGKPGEDLAENPDDFPADESPRDAARIGSAPIPPRPVAPGELSPALRWLEAGQNKLGCWGDGTFDEDGEPRPSTLVTALALLANVRAGGSHKQGASRAMVRMAILWARKVQANSGNFAEHETVDPLLHHAVASFAMAEAYGLSGDQVLKPIVDKAVEYIAASRGGLGAWGMQARDANPNVVATGWMLLALKSASTAGLVVDKKLFEDAATWAYSLRRNGSTAWCNVSDAMPDNDGSLEDAAMADAVFVLAVRWGTEAQGDPYVAAAMQRLLEHDPLWNAQAIDLMAWFFVALALAPDNNADWNAVALKQVNAAATTTQNENGAESSHWTSTDYWSERYGDVYTTALASILQTQCAPPPQPVEAQPD